MCPGTSPLNLVPTGRPGTGVQRARSQRRDDVRPDDGRLVDQIGSQDHPGHLRSVEVGRQHYGAASRALDRLPARWHGRCPAARRRHAGGAALPPNARATASSSAVAPLSRRDHGEPRRGARHDRALDQGRPVGFPGNAAEIVPELVRRGVRPDIVTDQTSAHDPVTGYLPKGWTLAKWEEMRERIEGGRALRALDARARRRHGRLPQGRRADARLRQQHPPDGHEEGLEDAFAFRVSCRPACGRSAGDRAVPLGSALGRPEDIYRTDRKVKGLCPTTTRSTWLDMARSRIAPGLPAR